jgi:hypothetical protein
MVRLVGSQGAVPGVLGLELVLVVVIVDFDADLDELIEFLWLLTNSDEKCLDVVLKTLLEGGNLRGL